MKFLLAIFTVFVVANYSLAATLEECIDRAAVSMGIDAVTNAFCKSGNLPGAPSKCIFNVTPPAQCEINAIKFGICISLQHLVSSCLNGGQPDSSHTNKIAEWMGGLNKCLACANKGIITKGITKIAPKVSSCAAKTAGKILTRVLGPIGIAYTVGELGAAAIEAYGDYSVSQQESKFACKNLPRVIQMKDQACSDAHALSRQFESRFCPIREKAEFDYCGPTGRLTEASIDPSCDDLCVTDEEIEESQALFRSYLDKKMNCLVKIRMHKFYYNACHKIDSKCK